MTFLMLEDDSGSYELEDGSGGTLLETGGPSVTVTTIQDGYDSLNEIQQITVVATDGTWAITLLPHQVGTMSGPSGLAWNISAVDLHAAIVALYVDPYYGGASVAKVGNAYTVEFNDQTGTINLSQMEVDRGGIVATLRNGGSQNAIQQITVNATGGTWDLHLQWWFDLLDIPWDISAADLESQLETLMDIGNCLSITKVGSVYTVEFIGALGSQLQVQMTAYGSGLT